MGSLELALVVILLLVLMVCFTKPVETFKARASALSLQESSATEPTRSGDVNLRANFANRSRVELQERSDARTYREKGQLRMRFTPQKSGNWSPWRHEQPNTPYYWYDAPHKTPGFECLDACYHRYDKNGCVNACRNIFNTSS